MIKLKPLSQLICPKCGKNEPVFFADYELRAWPIMSANSSNNDENFDYYDLDLENDFGGMASVMDDAIINGKAKCACSYCGTSILYYEETDDNET